MTPDYSNGDFLLLGHQDVIDAVDGREDDILGVIRAAYLQHAAGGTSVPQSVFLRPPGWGANRIIGLPAYVGPPDDVAGIKWISSFPANIENGLERASAVIVLNSTVTGRARAVLEGSVISAKRTAASAAVALAEIHRGTPMESLGVIGAGVINRETVRFVSRSMLPGASVKVYDAHSLRATDFCSWCKRYVPWIDAVRVDEIQAAWCDTRAVSIATTASEPHIANFSGSIPGLVVLNISLRDIGHEAILDAFNVVDDHEHVFREGTSLALARSSAAHPDEPAVVTIGQVLAGKTIVPSDRMVIFSPFGLGCLDLALAQYVERRAAELGRGTCVPGFLPPTER